MCRIVMRHMTSRMLRGTKGSGRSEQESGTVVEFQVLKAITKLIKKERLAPRKQPLIAIPIFSPMPPMSNNATLASRLTIDASATCILSSFNT